MDHVLDIVLGEKDVGVGPAGNLDARSAVPPSPGVVNDILDLFILVFTRQGQRQAIRERERPWPGNFSFERALCTQFRPRFVDQRRRDRAYEI